MTRAASVLTVLLAASAFPIHNALAQNSPIDAPLASGARVRFTLADAASPDVWETRRLLLKGTVTDVRRDSLVVNFVGAAPMTVSRRAIGDLSISRGTQRGWKAKPKTTAFHGVLVGTEAVLLVLLADANRRTPQRDRSGSMTPVVGLFALTSALFTIDAFERVERWERIPN